MSVSVPCHLSVISRRMSIISVLSRYPLLPPNNRKLLKYLEISGFNRTFVPNKKYEAEYDTCRYGL